jgi:DNA-binding NtrC family response regulator
MLFGTRKGAFTNALDKKGFIEEAENGTAFFDEIGDFPPLLQVKLLSVLDDNMVVRVGATVYTDVNARFVFATHRDLEKGIEDGNFREDLFERINVLDISLPPLRERKADIPLLVDHFIKEQNPENGPGLKFGPGAVDELFRYEWRRNVRELGHVIDKAIFAAGNSGTITDIMLHSSLRNSKHSPAEPQTDGHSRKGFSFDPLVDTWVQARDRLEEEYLRILWNKTKGNRQDIIRLSNRSRSQVSAKLRKYGISNSDDQDTTDSSDED